MNNIKDSEVIFRMIHNEEVDTTSSVLFRGKYSGESPSAGYLVILRENGKKIGLYKIISSNAWDTDYTTNHTIPGPGNVPTANTPWWYKFTMELRYLSIQVGMGKYGVSK